MKAIITGMNGTVAPVIARLLKEKGFEIISWDRNKVHVDNNFMGREFISSHNPDWILHIGMGSPDWAEMLAGISREMNMKFLFTSTAGVYTGQGSGPYDILSYPDANDDYGKYKIFCEQKIIRANGNAYIARLGWQIGNAGNSNNMIDFLEQRMAESGKVRASDIWLPSCSFLGDTANALYDLLTEKTPGLYLVNSNQRFSFYQIVSALNKKHGYRWNIELDNSFSKDDRMVDDRVNIPLLEEKLEII